MSSLKEKLIAIQKELKAPKNQHNDFGNYNYRSCEDILEAVKPLLEKYKVVMLLSDEVINPGELNYVRAKATLLDAESSDELCVTALARESMDKKKMDDPQMTGTASSYARKYALNGLFLIDDTNDADTNEYKKESDAKAAKAGASNGEKVGMASDKQVALILQLSKDANTITSYYKVKRLEDLTSKQASEVITQLKKGDKE